MEEFSILSEVVGARYRIETVDSLPLGNLTCAYQGLASMRCTWSTKGSYFELRTCLFSKTGPGLLNQDGTEWPVADLL